MVKNFTRKQLQEQLGLNAEKTSLILEYQKRLPILLEDSDSWIDVKNLWVQLGVGRDYTTWIKQQIKDMDLEEGLDYFTSHLQRGIGTTQGFQEFLQYNIKISTAKEIAMVAGAKGGRTSKELKENSKIARKYFIYMEEAIVKNIKWEEIRSPEKEEFNKMCYELDKHLMKTKNRNIDKWDRIYESNAINIVATGFEADEIRKYLDCKDKMTRDSLNNTYNNYILKLQEQNTIFIMMGLNRYQRLIALTKYFESTFPNAKPLVYDVEISKIIENKRMYIEEIKNKMTDSTLPVWLSA
jgi:phage anti-repressor protein